MISYKKTLTIRKIIKFKKYQLSRTPTIQTVRCGVRNLILLHGNVFIRILKWTIEHVLLNKNKKKSTNSHKKTNNQVISLWYAVRIKSREKWQISLGCVKIVKIFCSRKFPQDNASHGKKIPSRVKVVWDTG